MKKSLLVLTIVISLLLVCYITGSLVSGSWNPINWGKQEVNPGGEDNTKTQYLGGLMISDIESTTSMKLSPMTLAESTNGETSYKLTAYVYPQDAVTKRVNFYVEWEDDSDWSSDKNVNDYIQIERVDDSSIKVKCLAPFGERINLIARSDYDSSITASASLDYLKRLESVDLVLYNNYDQFLEAESLGYTIALNTAYQYRFVPTYGVGTLDGNFEVESLAFYLNEDYLLYNVDRAFPSYLPTYDSVQLLDIWKDGNTGFVSINEDNELCFADFSKFLTDRNQDHFDALNMTMYSENSEETAFGRITITYVYRYLGANSTENDLVYRDSMEIGCNIYFEKSSIGTPVSDVKFDKGNIVF